ncbi:MAG TPA: 4-alpha-glucanotransferase [Spirochaetia bacterium]|nr:4-alpha-glucanotransferase [Spirochaetia bacterium]
MRFPELNHYLTGVLVPVSALRSSHSCGIGEFADLPLLGTWCSEVGLELIQILPVNDTGTQSSPYSALSAFALHPVYIRLQDLPEIKECPPKLAQKIAALRAATDPAARVKFPEVLSGKLEILKELFELCRDSIVSGEELRTWIQANAWIRLYAAFRHLKEKNDLLPWFSWQTMRDPSVTQIETLWADPATSESLQFYAWVQMRLEQQLIRAAGELEALGVRLKGDLPILMDGDSADVWANRALFNLDLRAGAPPDMFSDLGQNWGFPIYDWRALERQEFRWWKERLRQADKYFHAYRIDHVLGFFRIWAIAARHSSGILGSFFPSSDITEEQLLAADFDPARIRWLAEPHIDRATIDGVLGTDATQLAAHCFEQIRNEDLYLFSGRIAGERDIEALHLEESRREGLLALFRNRALIRTGDTSYAPSWKFRDCSRYRSLSDAEKVRFEKLVAEHGAESEEIWEKQGLALLSFMNTTVPMLTCAEDLGVIPAAVPRVLEHLGILGLRIPRWARDWSAAGEPFVPPREYPFLTVCALSVHDTTTMREWWETEPTRELFWKALGFDSECPPVYDPSTAREIISGVLEAGSAICVLQVQDFFALSEALRIANSAEERVNVPGTYNSYNWTYRIQVTLEELMSHHAWNRLLRDIVSRRSRRSSTWTTNRKK